MMHLNKPLEVRTALGLTHTEAGRLLLGIGSHKKANDTWQKMERDNAERESLSNSMRQYLNLLLMLHICADLHTPGCSQALSKWLHLCRTDF